MDFSSLVKSDKTIIIDGSMGALLLELGKDVHNLLELNITEPEVLEDIHRRYYKAGCDCILTNTFNLNPQSDNEKIIDAALTLSNKVKNEFNDKFIGFDIGPSGFSYTQRGKDIYSLSYEYYKNQFKHIHNRCDFIIIETVSDITEMKAAIDAANDTTLPILASMTFTNKKVSWMGTSLSEWIELTNSANILAGGINCTLTPTEMLPLIKEYSQAVNKKVFCEPNKGQPKKTSDETFYTLDDIDYAGGLYDIFNLGIKIIGGCCGSSPNSIKEFKKLISWNSNYI